MAHLPHLQRGPQRRFARQLREASLRANPSEAVDLEALERLVRLGHFCVFEAQETLRSVIRGQHEREAA